MGSEYSCQTVESEEETVNKIFKNMFKKDIQSGTIYDNFIKCIIYYPNLKKLKLNKNLFLSFLSYVLEDNPYCDIYKEYFFSIIQNHSEIESIRKLGLIIIENAFGVDHVNLRKKYYMEHFKKFYLENILEKVENDSNHFSFSLGNDNSFYSNLNKESNNPPNAKFPLYYKKSSSAELENSREFYLDESIRRHDIKKTNSNDYIFINKPNNINKTYLADVDFCNNYDFNSSNFNFNATQNPNFISFIKKKELENLDSQILSLISDVIENNTNCLSYALKSIFSRGRIETLQKSWNKNNKKLLLLEIHRNYTSLVEKICLFPSLNSENIGKKHSHKNLSSNEKVQTMLTPKNNPSKKLIIDTLNKQIEIERLYTEEEVNIKGKFQIELEEFFSIKEKLISNFFELSETELSGDTIRNWLCENSKN